MPPLVAQRALDVTGAVQVLLAAGAPSVAIAKGVIAICDDLLDDLHGHVGNLALGLAVASQLVKVVHKHALVKFHGVLILLLVEHLRVVAALVAKPLDHVLAAHNLLHLYATARGSFVLHTLHCTPT